MSEKREISDGLRNLIMTILQKDPLKRPSANELKRNKWLNEGYRLALYQERGIEE